MVAEITYLTELSWLSSLILVGVIVAVIAEKIRFPDIFLLLVIGAIIGQFTDMSFNTSFLTGLGTFALIMIIFESSSKFKPREISQLSPYAIKLALVFLAVNLVALTFFTHIMFSKELTLNAIGLSVLFAAIMSGTSPSAVLSVLKGSPSKLIELIEFESIFNTPFTVILPLVIIKLYAGVFQTADVIAISFLQEVMTGVGAGIVMGLLAFRVMKNVYIERLSPLIIIAVSLITYTIATSLGGSGVLAITTLGIIFGVTQVKEKESLQKFIGIFSNFLKISVFVLLGLLIKVPLDSVFLLKSVVLFVLYLFIRFVAVGITFKNSDLNIKEKIFLSLNVSKGVAVAVVAFVVAASVTSLYINTILDLTYLFIFYSLLVASVTSKLSSFFLQRPTSISEIKGVQKRKEKQMEKEFKDMVKELKSTK